MPLQRYITAELLTTEQIASLPDFVKTQLLRLDWVFTLIKEKILKPDHLMHLTEPARRVLVNAALCALIQENRLSIECVLNLNDCTSKILSMSNTQKLLRNGTLQTGHIQHIINNTPAEPAHRLYMELFESPRFYELLDENFFTLEECFAWPSIFKSETNQIAEILTKKLLKKQELFLLKAPAASLLTRGILFYLLQQNIFTMAELNQLNNTDAEIMHAAMLRNGYSTVRLLKEQVLTIQEFSSISRPVAFFLERHLDLAHRLLTQKLITLEQFKRINLDNILVATPLLEDHIITAEELCLSSPLTPTLLQNLGLHDLLRRKILLFSDLQKAQTEDNVTALINPAVHQLLANGIITLEEIFRLNPAHLSIFVNAETLQGLLNQTIPFETILNPAPLTLEALQSGYLLHTHQAVIQFVARHTAKDYLAELDHSSTPKFEHLILEMQKFGFIAIWEEISQAIEDLLFTDYHALYPVRTPELTDCFKAIAAKTDTTDLMRNLGQFLRHKKNRLYVSSIFQFPCKELVTDSELAAEREHAARAEHNADNFDGFRRFYPYCD